MRRQLWIALTTVVVGLSLLTLAQRTPAGTLPGCCICNNCPSGDAAATCTDLDNVGGLSNCGDFCFENGCVNATVNVTMTGTCADVAACQAIPEIGAPSLGAGGLTLAGLLLAGIGLLQVLRLRRG